MSRHRIGVDLGGTKIEIAILAPDGSELLRHRIDTPHGYQASLEAIARLVRMRKRNWASRRQSASAFPASSARSPAW